MNTWIVCITESEAKIYHCEQSDQSLTFVHHFLRQEDPEHDFYGILADEMEYACGEGTTGRLILLGQPMVISQLCQKLTLRVREHIVGIIPRSALESQLDKLQALCIPYMKLSA